jgi:2-polyprenyl-6-methoxyphenol hydroxylase-like FAD-dependent oxidoreductase
MPRDAGVAGSGGITRPVLHKILSSRTLADGVQVRLGVSVEAIHQDYGGVDIVLSDGTCGLYDLLIGADGIYSRTRKQLFPNAPEAEYTGQSNWRIFTSRPAGIDRRHFFLGGPHKVGFTPVSDSLMYLFVAKRTPRMFRSADELFKGLTSLLKDYGGLFGRFGGR